MEILKESKRGKVWGDLLIKKCFVKIFQGKKSKLIGSAFIHPAKKEAEEWGKKKTGFSLEELFEDATSSVSRKKLLKEIVELRCVAREGMNYASLEALVSEHLHIERYGKKPKIRGYCNPSVFFKESQKEGKTNANDE